MNQFLLFLLLISGWTSSYGYSQTWIQTHNFPATERDDGCCFKIAGKAFCGTGLTPWFSATADFYALDFSNDNWTGIASLPAGMERQYACGFSNGQSGYVFGGINGNTYLNDLWKYDAVNNQWQMAASLAGAGRMGCSVFVIGDTAYVMGGKTANQNSISDFMAYSFSGDTWINKGHLPFGCRWRGAACTYNGIGYFIFGKDSLEAYSSQLFAFNPSANQWSNLTGFPLQGRTYAALQPYSNGIALMTGLDSLGNSYHDLWIFYPDSNSWQESVSLPATARRGGMSFCNNDVLYYSCGINESNIRLKETWKLQLASAVHEREIRAGKVFSPNPFNLEISLNPSLLEIKNGTLIIFDSTGKKIYERKGILEEQINTENFPSGIYFLQLIGPNTLFQQKLIKP